MIATKIRNKSRTFYLFSLAERASALEMLAAARNEHNPNLFTGFLNHAQDEYRHANIFVELALDEPHDSETLKPNTQDVKHHGYIDAQKFLNQKLDREKFGVFIAVHEHLAVSEFNKLCKKLDSKTDVRAIKQIVEDEEDHAQTILIDEKRHARLALDWVDKNVKSLRRKAFYSYFFITAKYNKLRGHAQIWATPLAKWIGLPLTIITLVLFRPALNRFELTKPSHLDHSLL
ncbi:ferritin-like domain-containing protein [Litorivicinus sp.]|nr:ferritin-like domain-containing protein [Litorivicinus sp.]